MTDLICDECGERMRTAVPSEDVERELGRLSRDVWLFGVRLPSLRSTEYFYRDCVCRFSCLPEMWDGYGAEHH